MVKFDAMILISSDKFKGTLSAREATSIMESAFREAGVAEQIMTLPAADGGEGTAGMLAAMLGLNRMTADAHSAAADEITAEYFVSDDRKVVAVDAASVLGLTLLTRRPDTMTASSAPLGRLLNHIINKYSPDRIYIGVGGTSTSDGGAGMVSALGARFFDISGHEIHSDITPEILHHVSRVDFSPMIRLPEIVFLCDVNVPLLAPAGEPSSLTFAPQKGLRPEREPELRRALERWVELAGINVGPFTGAGGGLASALATYYPPRFGARYLFELAGLGSLSLDLIVTGEGCVDSQSLLGKVTGTLAGYGSENEIPVVAIGGMVKDDPGLRGMFYSVYSTMDCASGQSVSPAERLRFTALKAARNLIRAGVLHSCGKSGNFVQS